MKFVIVVLKKTSSKKKTRNVKTRKTYNLVNYRYVLGFAYCISLQIISKQLLNVFFITLSFIIAF